MRSGMRGGLGCAGFRRDPMQIAFGFALSDGESISGGELNRDEPRGAFGRRRTGQFAAA